MKKVAFPERPLKTLNEMWVHSVDRHAERPAVCVRRSGQDGAVDYEPTPYRELEAEVVRFGKGLIELGLRVQEPVAIIAENGLRWLIADLAVLGNRACDVPRGVSSTTDELFYILNHAEVRIVLVGDPATLQRVLSVRDRLPRLESIVLLDPDSDPDPAEPSRGIFPFRRVLELGDRAPVGVEEMFHRRRTQTLATDTATILYTSGTTGIPKGAVLTHANIMHNVQTIPCLMGITSSDRFLSILPIWHILERSTEYGELHAGASLWYTTRLTILKDLAVVNPTWMVSVPRIWISVYNAVMAQLRRTGRQALFDRFYRRSLKVIHARRRWQGRQPVTAGRQPGKRRASPADILAHRLADLLIYRKIRSRLGRNFTAAVSGGGSLPGYIDDFFEVIGVTLLEGYGLTETSPVLCVRTPDHRVPYTVGRPLPATAIRILDEQEREVPEGEKGIIWASGPQVMSGYHRNPEESGRVLRTDFSGRVWFNTGDLGFRTPAGDLAVLGRIKDTIVLISGENAEPGPIEAALLTSEHIDQVMVCGQDQEYLTALIVPNRDLLVGECLHLGIEFDGERIPELSGHPELKALFMDQVDRRVKGELGFRELELIHDIAFTQPFVQEDGTMTDTLKLRRHRIAERDEALIRGMYPHYHDVRAAG